MSKYKVKKGHAFDNDIERIIFYLSRKNCQEKTITKILETLYIDLKSLRLNPMIGAKLSNKNVIPNEYRYLVSGNYLIIYKVYEKEKIVKVFHVFHGKENYLVKLNLI